MRWFDRSVPSVPRIASKETQFWVCLRSKYCMQISCYISSPAESKINGRTLVSLHYMRRSLITHSSLLQGACRNYCRLQGRIDANHVKRRPRNPGKNSTINVPRYNAYEMDLRSLSTSGTSFRHPLNAMFRSNSPCDEGVSAWMIPPYLVGHCVIAYA